MRRIALFLIIILASFTAAGCGQFGKRYGGDKNTSNAGAEKKITDTKWNAATRTKDGCLDKKEHENEGRQHTTDIGEKVTYKINPPVSGNHYEIAVEWGLYDKTQPDVQTVHNLEHGHIVVTHKGLTPKDQTQLLDQARINPFHLLVQPRAKNPKNGVYYTAWDVQIYCKHPSAAALQYMITEYRDQGPELYTDDASTGDMGV